MALTKIPKCPHCGSTDFTIQETLVYKAWSSEDTENTIECKHRDGGIDSVFCMKCNNEILSNLEDSETQFNFN